MSMLGRLYAPGLGLVNDLYQLTMAHGYWKRGMAETSAVFQLTFRGNPFRGGFTVAAGQELVAELVSSLSFGDEDLAYLASLRAGDGYPIFAEEFLRYLGRLELRCDVDALEEGSVCFPHTPVLRVTGPLLQGQLLETPVLNLVNFQSLIATKAARLRLAAGSDPLVDFGLRRAQGFDGGVSASRAAYLGGVNATSNLRAGQLLGVPVRGTHAHSWVMAFETELDAFRSYAETHPGEVTLLLDTYDTYSGLENAIEVAEWLRLRGRRLRGVRLDSGDLVKLSRGVRQRLDDAGLSEVQIVASGDLDEHRIAEMKAAGSRVDVWGVGTRLVTGWDQPAGQIAYKLGALHAPDAGSWRATAKKSEEAEKASVGGVLGVCRFSGNGKYMGDGVYDDVAKPGPPEYSDFPWDEPRPDREPMATELLRPLLRSGRPVVDADIDPPGSGLEKARERLAAELLRLPDGLLSLSEPPTYPVAIALSLAEPHRTGVG